MMKMIGFKTEYDNVLMNSKYIYQPGNDKKVTLTEKKIDILNIYLNKCDMIFSKTLALFDGNNYIGPNMIFSDGQWVWPSYFSYYLEIEGRVSQAFFNTIEEKNFKVAALTEDQRKSVTTLLEKEILNKI